MFDHDLFAQHSDDFQNFSIPIYLKVIADFNVGSDDTIAFTATIS
jgi:hypothetical protein